MHRKQIAFWIAATLTLGGIAPLPPAFAFTPTSELADVSPDHWAYNAIKTLVDKYQVMEGFSDNTFRGAKYVSRYELAAILAKVMARMEEMVASATGTSPTPIIPPSINPEDLRTISRLQQEFRDELTIMKGKFETFDQRLSSLENRMKVTGGLSAFYRTPTTSGLTRGLSNIRITTDLGLDARINDQLAFTGDLALFNNGVQSFSNGHLWSEQGARGVAGSAADSGMPFYVRKSYLKWTPGNWEFDAGMMSFAQTLPVGSTIKNGFASLPIWSEGQSGFGFVGTPALNQGNTQFYYPGTNRSAWMPGVNVVQDLLDPNSSPVNQPGSAPSMVLRSEFGPVEWGLGVNSGVPGADTTAATLDLPNSFPTLSAPYNGYALAKLGVDLGMARFAGYYRMDNSALEESLGSTGNGGGATIDLGNDELGLSLGYAMANRASIYATAAGYYHEANVTLASNNFLGTGWGLGVATKAGSVGNPTGSPFGWTSTGAYLRIPLFNFFPSLTFAAQTSGNSFTDSTYGSGFSAIAEIRPVPSLPTMFIEYDRGKFSGTDRGLLSKESPSDELLTVGTSIRF